MPKAVKKKVEALLLSNYMEGFVKRNVDEQFKLRKDICTCKRCKMDCVAYALNHLPPKYVVSDRGHIFTKLKEMEVQFNADVTREVYKAIEFVKGHERHT